MKSDRRVQYTRRALQESLVSLMREKPLEKISVKEICQRADINRSTFYVHFGSPGELLDSITQEMFEELKNMAADYSDLRQHMTRVCDLLLAHRDLLTVLIKGHDLMNAIFRISFFWKDDFVKNYPGAQENPQRAEAAYLYITSGSFALIFTWIIGEFSMPKEQLIDQIYDLIQHGLSDWFKED